MATELDDDHTLVAGLQLRLLILRCGHIVRFDMHQKELSVLLKSRCIAAIALLLAAASAIADEYPAKMVTLVVPAAAGGAVDANARVVGEAAQ